MFSPPSQLLETGRPPRGELSGMQQIVPGEKKTILKSFFFGGDGDAKKRGGGGFGGNVAMLDVFFCFSPVCCDAWAKSKTS